MFPCALNQYMFLVRTKRTSSPTVFANIPISIGAIFAVSVVVEVNHTYKRGTDVAFNIYCIIMIRQHCLLETSHSHSSDKNSSTSRSPFFVVIQNGERPNLSKI